MLRAFLFLLAALAARAELLDLAPFARPCCSTDAYHLQTTFDYTHPAGAVRMADGRYAFGLQWAEERDLFEILARFRRPAGAAGVRVEYWFRNWPYDPPHMPTIEDPADDPWQGEWLAARTAVSCQGAECRFTFLPLETGENPRAARLPGVTYRRAIKFRLVFPSEPPLAALQVFSRTALHTAVLHVEAPGSPTFSAYNGVIRHVRPFPGGADLTVDVADPRPPGSNDVTVIEVHNGDRSFAFVPADVAGAMHVPDFQACISPAAQPRACAEPYRNSGARIRERLAAEPEQSYERASREIPPLDPVERQGGRLYLPLAADASWQKFAFEWGGNVFVSKAGTQAYARERARLTWPGDRLSWRIGTGAVPSYRPRSQDSDLTTLDHWLPVAIARWSDGGIAYEEEAFATLLSGPLAPDDPARSEQTPAVLCIRMSARNAAGAPRTAHIWLDTGPAEKLAFDGTLLTAGGSVRARVKAPAAVVGSPGLHIAQPLAPGERTAVEFALPFIPGLNAAQRDRLAALDYAAERARVLAYWRGVAGRGVPFRVPEARFNTFAQGLLARIRISATKDPQSGLYMVPAASYYYQVYANEASFQAQWLDLAGYPKLAAQYLQTFVDLQGSRPFDGTYTGDQKAVYHGARVNADYDYTASQYNLDHGTVLWTLAEHYLVTRDREWLRRVAPSMKRAADWIVEQRRLTQVRQPDGRPCPEYGLLPAGHLEDNADWGHWFSVNAYAALGISTLAESLADAADPDAARYRREAAAYRVDLRRAVLRAAAEAPVIRLRDHTWVPYVPTRAHQRIRLFGPLRVAYYSRYPEKVLPTYRLSATRELLYGPLILLDTGIFDAAEPLAHWVLDDWEDNATMSEPLGLHVHGWVDEKEWFSRGGMVFQANLQNPIRTYIRRGEDRAAIRGLYNDFVACYYPSVNVFTEEFRQWRSPSGPFYKVPDEAKFVHRLRDLLVTEYDGDLLLAAATPERWLAPGQEIVVREAPTHFGPVSYTLCAVAGEVRAEIHLPRRNPYRTAWLSLHVPGRVVSVSGGTWDPARRRLKLPRSAVVRILARVENPQAVTPAHNSVVEPLR